MARIREYDCVGCDHCINCGRKSGYIVYKCDICKEETTDPDEIITDSGLDYCKSCYSKKYPEEDNEYFTEEQIA